MLNLTDNLELEVHELSLLLTYSTKKYQETGEDVYWDLIDLLARQCQLKKKMLDFCKEYETNVK